ncbi:MAG: hypothetical protein ACRD63_05930, partial [Pyrinomonadaceae bacterium]
MSLSLIIALCLFTSVVAQQTGSAKTKKEKKNESPETLIEKDSLHNLQVARQYFTLRKAYVATLDRCDEIMAANPGFAQIDEVLYLAGMSSYYLSIGLGKQKSKHPLDKLKQNARDYFSQLISLHPDSLFRKSAEERLQELEGTG